MQDEPWAFVFSLNKKAIHTHTMMGMSRRKEAPEGALTGKNHSNENDKINEIVLDYSPMYNLNTSESLLM